MIDTFRRGRDSIMRSLRRPRRKDMVVSNSGYTKKMGIPANRIRVTSSSSRHILAVIQCPSLLDILVGHAPVQDEQGKQEMWWREITAMVQGRSQPRTDLVALFDPTHKVGSISSLSVGAIEPQEKDAGGELLHDFLGKCDLMAANTFDGTGRRTWVPTRRQEPRIDHVVCPQRWLPMLNRAGTDDFSQAIADKEDHRPLFATFVLRE